MKIFSKYKDYYDSVQSLGFDKSVIYHRNEEAVYVDYPINFREKIRFLNKYNYSTNLYPKNAKNLHTRIDFLTSIVGFCGELFVVFKYIEINNSIQIKTNCFYEPENAKSFVKNLRVEINRRTFSYLSFGKESILDKYDTVKKQIDSIDSSLWFHHFDCPIFEIKMEDIFNSRSLNNITFKNYQLKITRNPILKNLEFYKIKDSYTCYQDIQQYISGVLTNTEKNESKMTDKQKIHSHGFDKKYGFRTRPKNK